MALTKYTRAEQIYLEGLIKLRRPKPVVQKTLPRTRVHGVALGCGHASRFVAPLPRKGDMVFCRRCNDHFRVVAA